MRVDRIPEFARSMIPSLADLAGEMIKKLDRVSPDRRQSACESMYNAWVERSRHSVHCLAEKLFAPANPWSEEAFMVAAKLLQAALFRALESDSIWDRRLSASTIASRIGAAMYGHILAFATDRGMNRDLHDPLYIGCEGITLEGSHHDNPV